MINVEINKKSLSSLEMKICAEATEDTDHKTLNVGLKLLKANPEKLYMDVEGKNG